MIDQSHINHILLTNVDVKVRLSDVICHYSDHNILFMLIHMLA